MYLRGSALQTFADAGASELEIRAISGHSIVVRDER